MYKKFIYLLVGFLLCGCAFVAPKEESTEKSASYNLMPQGEPRKLQKVLTETMYFS